MSSKDLASSLISLQNKSKLYIDNINRISADIKYLESMLQNSNIGIPTELELFHHQALNEEERNCFVERPVPGWQFLHAYVKETIAWQRDKQSGKFRLIYWRTLYEDRIGVGGGIESGAFSTSPFGCQKFPDGITEFRPLIECSIEIRIRLVNELPKLVQLIERNVDKFITDSTDADDVDLI